MSREGLKWESRADGMYLAVSPEAPDIDIAVLESEFLDDYIMNADFKRIGQVINAKSGRPEFVGPSFLRFDKPKLEHLELITTTEYVKLTIFKSILKSELTMTVKDIEFVLKQRRVCEGIDWSFVAKIINNGLHDDPHIIARAKAAIPGKDAKIIEEIVVDPDARPLVNFDGSVDFRNLENIQQVSEGDVICRRVPPTEGIPGLDVFGHTIDAPSGLDKILPRGKNTEITDDSLELRASSAGYLYREGIEISVGKLYVVPGHVNFKTGNIRYSGDVAVRGNVLADFQVEADGDITIEGEVEGARIISHGGFVHIKKGVFGKGKAYIEGAKGVRVHMAQGAEIVSEGAVQFDLNLMDSQVKALSLKASGNNTLINNCEIVVYEEVITRKLGTPSGGTTRIEFLNSREEDSMAKFQELNELYGKLKTVIEQLEKRLRTMKAILKKATEVTVRSKEELKTVLLQYESSKKKLALVEKKRNILTQAMSDKSDLPGKIIIDEFLPKLVVDMYGEEKEYQEAYKDIMIHWAGDDVKLSPKESEKA